MDIRGQMSPLQLQMLQAQYDAQQAQQAQQGLLNPLMIQKLQQELEQQQQVEPLKLQMLQQELSNQQLQGQGAASQLDFNAQLQPLQLEQQMLKNQYYPQQVEAEMAMQQMQKDIYMTQKQAQLASMAQNVVPLLPQGPAIDLPGLQAQRQKIDNVASFLPTELADRIRGMYPATQLPPEQLQPFVDSMQANSQTPFVAGQQVSQAIQQQPDLQGSLSPMQQNYLQNFQAVSGDPTFDQTKLPAMTPKDAEVLMKWQKMNPEGRRAEASPNPFLWFANGGAAMILQQEANRRMPEYSRPLPPNFYNR